jgi:hypothetical protein
MDYSSGREKKGREGRAASAMNSGKLCHALSGDGDLRFRPLAYSCDFSSGEGRKKKGR